MQTHQRWLGTLVLVAAAGLAGCGGGSDDSVPAPPAPGIGQSVTALIAFVQGLIAGTDDTSDPIDIDALSLAVDDTAEPAPL